MTDYIKQLESKVKDCNNTNTIFDTRKYVLLEDAKEVLNKALNIAVVIIPKGTLSNLEQSIKRSKPNMDKIKDVDKYLDSIR